jgi:hypothetical protein
MAADMKVAVDGDDYRLSATMSGLITEPIKLLVLHEFTSCIN